MMPLPTADWKTALNQMSASLEQSLSALDRYQTEWAQVTEAPVVAAQPEMLLSWLERRLAQWDEQLNAAGELTDGVRHELDNREEAFSRWQEVFVRWQQSIEQKKDSFEAR